MATALNPTRWDSGVSPAGAGSVSISWTDSSTTFRATANSGWKFDHWVFTPYGGQWMPQVQEDFSKNLNNATHVSGRYRFDPDVNPQYADAGVMGTAYFVPDSPGPDTVTITLISDKSWGQVQFAGETPTTGTVSKTVPVGTVVTIDAAGTDGRSFGYWQQGENDYYINPLSFTATTDITYTAIFCYQCIAKVASVADPGTIIPVGEVRIRDGIDETGPTSAWGTNVSMALFNDYGVVYVEQRSLGNGWSFVKWRLRGDAGVWWEDTAEHLYYSMENIGTLEAVALFERTPTDLLVNSNDFATPVRLTYDDRAGGTGLLVADY